MSQPWLDSLSDDWPSMPASPTSPAPAHPLPSSPRASLQVTPSRIPVPARRSEQQSPVDGKKKVTRPCHFHRKEPPTPKTPRTPKTPKPRSPAPDKSKSSTPMAKESPRRGSGAVRKSSAMDHRSPLRSVSNVSNASKSSEVQSNSTVQIKTKKGKDTQEGTPEWRRRLLRGEIEAGEQRDLFAPMGLESVFKPPPQSSLTQQDSIPFSKQDDQLWDFTDNTSRQGRDEEDNRDQESEPGPERVDSEDEGLNGNDAASGTVNPAPCGADATQDVTQDPEGFSQGNTQLRTASRAGGPS